MGVGVGGGGWRFVRGGGWCVFEQEFKVNAHLRHRSTLSSVRTNLGRVYKPVRRFWRGKNWTHPSSCVFQNDIFMKQFNLFII